jgi:hypothetical protein
MLSLSVYMIPMTYMRTGRTRHKDLAVIRSDPAGADDQLPTLPQTHANPFVHFIKEQAIRNKYMITFIQHTSPHPILQDCKVKSFTALSPSPSAFSQALSPPYSVQNLRQINLCLLLHPLFFLLLFILLVRPVRKPAGLKRKKTYCGRGSPSLINVPWTSHH